jgi:hypothetical protein
MPKLLQVSGEEVIRLLQVLGSLLSKIIRFLGFGWVFDA